MVGDHHQPTARPQHPKALFERHPQRLHFAVDLDAQRLKELGEELRLLPSGRTRRHGRYQRVGRCDRRGGTGPLDAARDLPRRGEFAPVAQHARERIAVVGVDHVGRSPAAAAVHPHVERRRAAEREAPLDGVEMVRRNTQIGQNAVDLRNAPQAQRSAQKAEIALHVMKAPVVGTVGERIAVLVETVEPPFGPQQRKNTARMAAAAEGQIDVSACRIDREQSDGLLEQHRSMVALLHARNRYKSVIWG